MLIRRSHIALLCLASLAFPAVALAATGGEGDRPGVGIGPAKPAHHVALHGTAEDFDRLVAEVAARNAAERKLRAERKAEREEREEREFFEDLPGGVTIETLTAIGDCESGGDPTIVSADGSFRGKYQFMVSTWESVGGSGDPAAAPEIEQDYRAALLYAQSGSSPWPVCG